jgi:hypothetical protein
MDIIRNDIIKTISFEDLHYGDLFIDPQDDTQVLLCIERTITEDNTIINAIDLTTGAVVGYHPDYDVIPIQGVLKISRV